MNRLDIYVRSGCISCRRAREIAMSLRGSYPGVLVELVDAEALPEGSLPEPVVALPAYLLNGALISLGNPNPATLREQLAALVLGRG